jgi:hypothetical protein
MHTQITYAELVDRLLSRIGTSLVFSLSVLSYNVRVAETVVPTSLTRNLRTE